MLNTAIEIKRPHLGSGLIKKKKVSDIILTPLERHIKSQPARTKDV